MPSLLAILGLDTNPFSRNLANSVGQAQRAGSRIASALTGQISSRLASLASVSAIVGFSKQTIDWASNLRDVSDALQVNVEFLQKLQNGAKAAGGDLEDIRNVMMEINKSRQDAAQNPKGKNAQALGRLGFSGGQISSLSGQAFMEKLIEAFANGASPQKINDLQEVGGRAAKNLAAAFANQFASETPILAEDLVDQLDEVGDKFTSLSTALKVTFAPVIVFVTDLLNGLVQWIQRSAKFFEGFADVFDFTLVRGKKNPLAHIKDVKKNFFDAILEGERQRSNEEERQKEAAAKSEAARNAAKAARREKENARLQFDKTAPGEKLTNFGLNSNQRIGAQAFINPDAIQMIAIQKDIRNSINRLINVTVDGQRIASGAQNKTEF